MLDEIKSLVLVFKEVNRDTNLSHLFVELIEIHWTVDISGSVAVLVAVLAKLCLSLAVSRLMPSFATVSADFASTVVLSK